MVSLLATQPTPHAPGTTRRAPQPRRRVAMASLLACLGMTTAVQAKSFIDYLKPAPIVCSPLSSETWGADGVLPRDVCNGIESAKGKGVPPEFYYWDGKILKAKDGTYHLFMSTWSGSAGFNPGWTGSDAYHAISEQGVLGPYKRQDYVYTDNGSHKGHNVSALELPDGSYAVIVSETVPFNIYKSSSMDGPWTKCTAEIRTAPGVNGGTDTRWASNVSLVARHDGKFQIVQRHGLIAIADALCGPYVMQKPTWKYPAANRPTIDSIYPRRTEIPGVSNPTYAWEEDPHIWRSGGLYHVLYSGSGDRVGWHLYSPDGINDWTDGGLSCNPRLPEKIFGYEGSTVSTKWYKMERPGVVLENGRVTHVTWAVADVDKDNQIPANSNHGSKVIVIPFDGVAFEVDYGGGAGATNGSAGASGTLGIGGATGKGGTSASGGSTGASGSRSETGSSGVTGGSAAFGSRAQGGISSGGTKSSNNEAATAGGNAMSSASGGRGGRTSSASGGSSRSTVVTASSTGGSSPSSASAPGTSNTNASGSNAESATGCSCTLGSTSSNRALVPGLLLGLLGIARARRRSRAGAMLECLRVCLHPRASVCQSARVSAQGIAPFDAASGLHEDEKR